VRALARNYISLKELGVERIEMCKAATGAIVIRVPGDRERDKAAKLATKLASVLDPIAVKIAAQLRRAKLKVKRIDISVNKEELRHALAFAAGCKGEEVQVGEIGIARGGLGTVWVRCQW
jgi:predicted hydrolase (HD superfamily)